MRFNLAALPDDLTPEEKIGLLDEYLRLTVDHLNISIFALRDSLDERIRNLEASPAATARVTDERAEQEHQRVVSGLRIEAYGFILLTFGTLIQAGGSYLGIDVPTAP